MRNNGKVKVGSIELGFEAAKERIKFQQKCGFYYHCFFGSKQWKLCGFLAATLSNRGNLRNKILGNYMPEVKVGKSFQQGPVQRSNVSFTY